MNDNAPKNEADLLAAAGKALDTALAAAVMVNKLVTAIGILAFANVALMVVVLMKV